MGKQKQLSSWGVLKVKILKEEEIIIVVEDTIQHHHNKEIDTNINMVAHQAIEEEYLVEEIMVETMVVIVEEGIMEEVEIAVDPADLVEVETVEGDLVGVEMVVDAVEVAVEVVETRNQKINNTMSI